MYIFACCIRMQFSLTYLFHLLLTKLYIFNECASLEWTELDRNVYYEDMKSTKHTVRYYAFYIKIMSTYLTLLHNNKWQITSKLSTVMCVFF